MSSGRRFIARQLSFHGYYTVSTLGLAYHPGDGAVPKLQAVAKDLGAVLLSKRIADAINGAAGWKHGHTYQAHLLACTASLAV